MKLSSANAVFITLALLSAAETAFADRFSRASGNWSNTGGNIWSATSCVAGAITATAPGAGDNVTICTGTTVTQDVASTTINTLTVNGTLNLSSNTLIIDNTTAVTLNTGGVLNANTSTVQLNRDNATTVAAGTAATIGFNNLTFNPTLGGARIYTLAAGSITSMTVSGNLAVTPPSGGGTRSLAVAVGTLTTAGGGLTVTGTMQLDAGGDETTSLSTGGVNMSFGRLSLGGTGTGTQTFTMTNAAHTVTMTGTSGTLITRNTNGVFAAGTTGTVLVQPSAAANVQLNGGTGGTLTFNNLTINDAANTVTLGAATIVNTTALVSAGTLSNNGSAFSGDGTATLQVNDGATYAMTGTTSFPASFSTYTFNCGAYPSCSTVSYRQTSNPLTITNQTYGHLELAPAGTATQQFAASTYTINGDLLVGNATNAATADAATNSAVLDVNGSVNIKASSTLQAHASNLFTVARDWTNNGTFTHNNGTVTFDSANASGLSGTTTFYNLTLTKSAAAVITANAAQTINNTLTISNSNTTLADGGNTITAKGNISNAGTHSGTGKIYLNAGAAAHTLSGTGTYGNLEVDDVLGATLSASPTVSGTLTFTTGNLTTGSSNTLNVGSAGSVSGAGTARHVVGNLAKAYAAATTFNYAVGDGTNYTPVQVTFTAAATGNLTGAVTNTDHPNTTSGASGIDSSKSINRYWTLKSSTITGTYSAAFSYINGTPTDRDAGVAVSGSNLTNATGRRGTTCTLSGPSRTCTTWAGLTLSGTPTTTAATATGVSITSGAAEADFILGEAASSNLSREKQFIYTRELY